MHTNTYGKNPKQDAYKHLGMEGAIQFVSGPAITLVVLII
jgi:hypothetical protein